MKRIAGDPAKYASACDCYRKDVRAGAFVVTAKKNSHQGVYRVAEVGWASAGDQVASFKDAYLSALVEESDPDAELVVTVRCEDNREALSASLPLEGGISQVHVMPQNAGMDLSD